MAISAAGCDSGHVKLLLEVVPYQILFVFTILPSIHLSSSSSSFISDSRSIEIRIKQHRGQTGNIHKYTQKDISNTESERDQQDRNKKK